jgi:hypothetical protein
MNDFDDFQKRQVEIYKAEKSIEYLTLKLTSEVGRLADETALIVRGDYENKGTHVYEDAIDDVMGDCYAILRYVALIATVLEKKLSDVVTYGVEARKQHTL